MNLRNGQITLRELLSNPKAYQILQRESPVPLNHPLVRRAGNMTLNQLLGLARGRIPQGQVNRILEDLRNI
ncbi:hypothetical protein [Acetivibrio sp. MSJd-27]|uniref:hypothetical protein n=1 Tax=Acetivibrio sp. MSJd-27 TaxID=2841523 RepID=UPI0015A915B7|nr:hypothetical protein [Acetivibrio sp. MSJd-27]MBU5451115.1 hypothetical protein [Acetivibrio sp. MSJd-27]